MKPFDVDSFTWETTVNVGKADIDIGHEVAEALNSVFSDMEVEFTSNLGEAYVPSDPLFEEKSGAAGIRLSSSAFHDDHIVINESMESILDRYISDLSDEIMESDQVDREEAKSRARKHTFKVLSDLAERYR